MRELPACAFRRCCSLRHFVVPCHVSSIGSGCFGECTSLVDLSFENGCSVTEIHDEAFRGCSSLNHFVVPRSVASIGRLCFEDCVSLENLHFEQTPHLGEIGAYAFYGCQSLVRLILPAQLQYIGRGTFDGCTSVKAVVFEPGSQIDRECLKHSGLENHVQIIFSKQTRSTDLGNWIVDISTLHCENDNLGSGGSGSVKLFKRQDGTLIAGKFLASDEHGMNQTNFEREVCNLLCLEHQCIVPLIGYALPSRLTSHNFVIFTEYISGGSLSDVIGSSDKPDWFDSTARAIIVCGIVSAMKLVHALDIVHRDLKPSNVLLDEQHYPRLSDFGSSRVLSGESTLTTAVPCTLYYAAPELSDESGVYTSKIDVYSFGVMLYEIVTGKFALRNFNAMQLLGFIIRGKRPEIPSSVSTFTSELITRCWAPEPDDRPSFSEIYQELVDQGFRIFSDVDSDTVCSFANSLQ